MDIKAPFLSAAWELWGFSSAKISATIYGRKEQSTLKEEFLSIHTHLVILIND